MSHCRLEKIDIFHDHNSTDKLFYIIIVDFHGNQLTDTIFIKSHIFHRTVFLDLYYNLLHTFKYGRHFYLKYLSVLYLIGNNLSEID